MLDGAERFVATMPAGQEGLAFLEGERPVQPNPEALQHLRTIAGRRGGHWPSSPDIAAAMIVRGKDVST